MNIKQFKKKFGTTVKNYRNKCGLSQSNLAERLDVEVSTVARIESGENFTSAEIILALSEIFNISYGELFGVPCRRRKNTPDAKIRNDIDVLLSQCSLKKLEILHTIIKSITEDL